MGSSSAALRRLISAAKSNKIPTYLFAAKRLVTSSTTPGGACSFEPATSPSPCLMLDPPDDGPNRSITRLYSPATNEIYNFCSEEYSRRSGSDWGIVGTSHGWLGLYNSNNHDVLLLDPVTDRIVRLPSMGSAVHALISVENTRLAVAVAAGGRLALCRNGGVWTSFPSDKAHDNISYSSRHNRLFCITRDADADGGSNNKSNLEIWDLGEGEGDTPKREWEMDLNVESNNNNNNNNNMKKLMYVACAEHSGEVFVVVRHVTIQHGKTDHFKVYKVDEDGRRLILVKDSLEGLAMFVGANHPLVIPAKEVAGVKPDSVYFTYDRRMRSDNGIYDYLKMKFSPVCTYNCHHVPLQPLWFTSPHVYI